jgi:rhodanese-related sulfurtransferase
MEVEQLSAAEVARAAAAGAVIVDVREQDEWEAGHIPGSLHEPLAGLLARAGGLPPAARTVFVCRSGSRSDVAAAVVARTGRPGCANLRHGLHEWEDDGLPLEPADGLVI